MPHHTENLSEKIRARTAEVSVIGLGYVGLPLAVEIAKAGFKTVGFDISKKKVASINRGENYIKDINNEELALLVKEKKLCATSNPSILGKCDFISICVPTPLGKGKDPDMSFIVAAVNGVKKGLRKGQVIILESTTYPGTTEELVQPALEETGLKAGEDFHLAFSPERIDPGNGRFGIRNTPKVIGGVTRNCTEIAQSFYGTFIERIVPVSSPRAAEMVKILENTFRAINIGLANEVAIMCNHMGIDTWEVIEAAATKPFGFMPFYPGPGLGGHCIPIDPHYLVWKMKINGYNPRFIQLADEINSSMPNLVVDKIIEALNRHGKAVNGSKILVLGVAYKKDIDDFRESPALNVIHLLQQKGGLISYNDLHVPTLKIDGIDLVSTSIANGLNEYDCIVILTNHSSYDIERIVRECRILVDTRNATKGIFGFAEKIFKI